LLYRQIIKPQHLWLECYFFFVSSNKEKVTKKACPEQGRGKPILLSFSAMRKKVSKACPERSRGKRIADTALSASYYTTTFVVGMLLFLCLQQQRKSNQKENAALCGFLLYSFLLHSKLVFFRFYTKTLLLTLMPFSCRHP